MTALEALGRGLVTAGVVSLGLVATIGSTPEYDFGGGGGTTSVSVSPPPDNPPTYCNAGEDQTVLPNAIVQLDGEGYDREGRVTPDWRQETGPTVQLSNSSSFNPTFTAPAVAELTELRFRLRVIDGAGQVGANGVDRVSIWVDPDMTPPPPVLLDFETLPNGLPTVDGIEIGDDYLAYCVTFSNFEWADASAGPIYVRQGALRTLVTDTERVFNPPPETPFDVALGFSVPVNLISADVYAMPGNRVVLTAYGLRNTELGSVTSSLSSACCVEKTDTLVLEGLGPIYRARFQTDRPFASMPLIDNVRLASLQHCELRL